MVAVDHNVRSSALPTVDSENFLGAVSAVEYLIGLGHRRIGFVAGRADLESARLREAAYRHALERAGIAFDPKLVREGGFQPETAHEATNGLLALEVPPTAIFAANDAMALAVMSAATARGLSIPGDLSVIGFDNVPESALTTPPLTTVEQPIRQMGVEAVRISGRCSRTRRGRPSGWCCPRGSSSASRAGRSEPRRFASSDNSGMTTLENRPNTALLVIDVQNGVVEGATSATPSSRTSAASSRRRGRSRSPWSGCSTPASSSREAATKWRIVPELTPGDAEPLVEKNYGDSFEDTTLETVLSGLGVGRLVVVGAQTDACVRSTLHGAFARGYDAILVSDAHTTEDLTEWGAPPPDQVIAHTNLYWSDQTAPGERPGRSRPGMSISAGLRRTDRAQFTEDELLHQR